MVATIVMAFLLGLIWEYSYVLEKEKSYLNNDAEIIVDNIAGVLGIPVWRMDRDQIEKIIDQYDDFYIVKSIKIVDENQNVISQSTKKDLSGILKKSKPISYQQQEAGIVIVEFTDRLIRERIRMGFYTSAMTLTLVILFLIVICTWLLSVKLGRPLREISAGLANIGDGNYDRKLVVPPQKDLGKIAGDANLLGEMIRTRELDLEKRNHFLLTLNEAMLHLVRIPVPDQLLQQAAEWLQKTTGALSVSFNPAPKLCSLLRVRALNFQTVTGPEIQGRSESEPIREEYRVRVEQGELGSFCLNYEITLTDQTRSMGHTLIRLVEESIARYFMFQEKSKHEAELDLAKVIQESILPRGASMPLGADISWYYNPADRIGGDWFFYHESVKEQALYVMMGDVTGHGFSSGLLATSIVSALMAAVKTGAGTEQVLPSEPDQLLNFIHSIMNGLSMNSPLSMSCIVLKWDYHSGLIRWCNGGHTFPILLAGNPDGGESEVIALAGERQGTLGKDPYQWVINEVMPEPGAVLLLYTDGLTEVKSSTGMQFSRVLYRRLKSLTVGGKNLDQLLVQLADEMKLHLGDQVQSDDCCILMVRRPEP